MDEEWKGTLEARLREIEFEIGVALLLPLKFVRKLRDLGKLDDDEFEACFADLLREIPEREARAREWLGLQVKTPGLPDTGGGPA